MELSQDARAELEKLQGMFQENGDTLEPEDVLEYARDSTTELHSQFEWDDSIAAEQYRIQQARRILQVWVRVVETKREPSHVSVTTTTTPSRQIVRHREVSRAAPVSSATARLIEEAKEELRWWRKRYDSLTRISGVTALESIFREIDKLIPDANETDVSAPCKAHPGSIAKLDALSQRLAAGLPLFTDGDGIYDEDEDPSARHVATSR